MASLNLPKICGVYSLLAKGSTVFTDASGIGFTRSGDDGKTWEKPFPPLWY